MFFMGERRDGPPRQEAIGRARPDDRVVVNVFETRPGRGGASFESRALGGERGALAAGREASRGLARSGGQRGADDGTSR